MKTNTEINNFQAFHSMPDKIKLDKEQSQKITRFASIDMPWMKYYNPIPAETVSTDMNMFDYFTEVTKEYGDIVLLEY